LAKRIAELHDGRASVVSDGPGCGSTFTVELPQIAALETSSVMLDGKPKNPIRPRRVLLIEDNDDARATLRALLEASGDELYEASDGPGGVEKALAIKPDVVLVDLRLPSFDGYEVASRIYSAPERIHTVLIALTGYGQDEYRRKSNLARFHGYLVKPGKH
jgi:CheY-like chemotaxis protein